jgi:hexosaminidase
VTRALVLLCFACSTSPELQAARNARDALLPVPATIEKGDGQFAIADGSRVFAEDARFAGVAMQTANALRLTVATSPDGITLAADDQLADGAYRLSAGAGGVRIEAHDPAGAFWGVQTLRQLLPESGRGLCAEVKISDAPRYPWRGLMIDVARHFFTVDEVKRYLDLAARFKLDRLHLHLSDDQGWRIEIKSWPDLTRIGGAGAVGGGPGGFYTQSDYADLVAYAADRFITVVPELDMPGHINAALTSYPQLTCDGVAPPADLTVMHAQTSLCVSRPETYQFLDDVVGEMAALQPGGYFHIGGDEAVATAAADYTSFMTRAQATIASHGMQMIGWEEVAGSAAPSLLQIWLDNEQHDLVTMPAILSPLFHAYLDIKYDSTTPVGTAEAGYVEIDQAYEWDPEDFGFAAVAGVEAPLWTETIATRADADYMMFPRLCGIAEIAWSPRSTHDYRDYTRRLAAWGPRLSAMGIGFYRSPLVAW